MIRPIVLALIAGIVLLGGAYALLDHLKTSVPAGAMPAENGAGAGSDDFMKSFVSLFRESCVSSAKTALTQKGVDASTAENAAKIDTYCGCAVQRIQSDLSVQQILAFKLNPSSEPAASKMKTIVAECGEKIGKFGP
jgi:hypothetical protein